MSLFKLPQPIGSSSPFGTGAVADLGTIKQPEAIKGKTVQERKVVAPEWTPGEENISLSDFQKELDNRFPLTIPGGWLPTLDPKKGWSLAEIGVKGIDGNTDGLDFLPHLSEEQVSQIHKNSQAQEQAKMAQEANTPDVQKQETYVNFTLADLATDIKAGMPIEELPNLYSDVPQSIIGDLYTDIKNGMPLSEARKLYPELASIQAWDRYDEPKEEYRPGQYSQQFAESLKSPQIRSLNDLFGNTLANVIGTVGSGLENVIAGAGGLIEKQAEKMSKQDTMLNDWIESVAKRVFTPEQIASYQALPEEQRRTFNTTVSQDLLNLGEGVLQSSMAIGAPLVTVGLSMASELPVSKQVIEKLGQGTTYVGSIINMVPGLKDFKESLPEEDQARFDAFVGNTAIGMLLGMKGKKNIVKNPRQFIADNLTPPQIARNFQENVLGLPSKLKKLPETMGNVKAKIGGMFDITGLDDSTKAIVENNPYFKELWEDFTRKIDQSDWQQEPQKLYQEYLQSSADDLVSRIDQKISDLKETSPLYKEIRQNPKEFSIAPAKEAISEMIADYGIKVKDWKLDFTESNIGSQTDMTKIQRAYDRIMEQGDTFNADKTLNLRGALDDTAGWEEWATTKSSNIIKQMRREIDAVAKDEIEGLRSLDAEYSKQIKELQEVKTGIVNKKTGEALSTIYSKVKNIDSLANTALAERIDKIDPSLRERVEAVNTFNKVYKQYSKPVSSNMVKLISTIGGSLIGESWLGRVGGWIGGYIVGNILDKILERGFSKVKKSQIEAIINNVTPEQISRLEEISTKIRQQQALNDADKKALDDIATTVRNSIEEETQKKVESDKAKEVEASRLENEQRKSQINMDEVISSTIERVGQDPTVPLSFQKYFEENANILKPSEDSIVAQARKSKDGDIPTAPSKEYVDPNQVDSVPVEQVEAPIEDQGAKPIQQQPNSNENSIVVYRWTKKGGNKKFSLDYYTPDEKAAATYGDDVEKITITPKKLADATNPTDDLLQIIKDNWSGGQYYDLERLRKLAMKEKFGGVDFYEVLDDPNVVKALKKAGYDYIKYNDFTWPKGKFAKHETYAKLESKK